MLVLDDLGDWRGLGTALHLAESGHEVTIVTVGAGRRRRARPQCRRRPASPRLRAGGRPVAHRQRSSAGVTAGALIRFHLTGDADQFEADTLVIAETAVSETTLADAI